MILVRNGIYLSSQHYFFLKKNKKTATAIKPAAKEH
jgi:hypothetical protein